MREVKLIVYNNALYLFDIHHVKIIPMVGDKINYNGKSYEVYRRYVEYDDIAENWVINVKEI